MTKSLLDRAIAAVDPVRAAQRAKARLQLDAALRIDALSGDAVPPSAPSGGSGQTLRWWRPGTRDAAGDTLPALSMQRAQIRELVRTNPIAGGAIDTNVNRTVGTGLALVSQPVREVLGWDDQKALAWKRMVQTEFSLWADSTSCDWDGEQNFYDKQGLTLRSALESGDSFTLMPDGARTPLNPYALRLQTIEADRVGNPNNGANTPLIAGGVERSQVGSSKRYYVYDMHPGSVFIGAGQASKPRFVGQWYDGVGPSGRRRILHHFRQLRPEQPRGVPYLAPIIDHLKQLGRYSEAEIQAAVMSAMFTVFVETSTGATPAPIFGTTDGQIAADPEIGMGPGAIVGLVNGEKAAFADPTRPNTSFDPFVKSIVWQIGVGLGLPYELLIKQFNASYSASKAALLDAWMWFRSQRTWLARSFCQPVFETWLAEAVATGRVSAPGFFTNPLLRWAYSRADWHGDSQGSINPKDEVAAYSAAVDARLMTRERAEWELFGSDWYETFDAKKTEQTMLADAELLPVPKAGAAAEPSDTPAATATAEALMLMANKPAPEPPHVTIHQAAPVVTVQPPSVEIHQGDSHVHMPEGLVQLDAHIAQPEITVQAPTVNVDVPAPQVTVMQQRATRQTITRDPVSGEIVETLTEPVSPTTH